MTEAYLQFDEEIVCTKLAKEYLSDKTEFYSIGPGSLTFKTGVSELDQFQKKIYYCETDNGIHNIKLGRINDTRTKFSALADKINENSELFCQLEFLLRNIPIQDTRTVDLKLICQSLLYNSAYATVADKRAGYTLEISKDTPLYYLGLIACTEHLFCVNIVCTEETVAVCTLFVELCREVGLEDDVVLRVMKFLPSGLQDCDISTTNGGCVAVVSARADVDSAAAALLGASARYPWRPSLVLVQDAALERWDRAVAWHARGGPPAAAPARLPAVEGFRSVREALALTAARGPLAVAAWTADLAEANEIAFGVRASLVWLNGHGWFDGPPAVAAPVYCTCMGQIDPPEVNEEAPRHTSAAWRAKSRVARLQLVRRALANCPEHSTTAAELLATEPDCVSVDRAVCIVTKAPREYAAIYSEFVKQYLKEFLGYLVDGGGFLVSTLSHKSADVKQLCDSLSEVGAPIVMVEHCIKKSIVFYKSKAIWLTIGTMFAN